MFVKNSSHALKSVFVLIKKFSIKKTSKLDWDK
jgi:hypothetical protein